MADHKAETCEDENENEDEDDVLRGVCVNTRD